MDTAAAFRRHRRVRQVEEHPVRPFAAAASRRSAAADVKPSRAAVGARRRSYFFAPVSLRRCPLRVGAFGLAARALYRQRSRGPVPWLR